MSVVYLIGAGPGDPGLITVRGQQCLAGADVVIYDRLVHGRLLRHARADAERIDVGQAAPKPLELEAICYLLAEKAREGRTVARLKWGDPFVFDSGGPEALFLHEQRVRFEVVPGIPAGVGIPAYAGVPITYPGGGDTLTFVRGHENEGHTRAAIDWTGLAKLDGTIVCYAGPEQAHGLLSALLAHGRPEDEPAALIYQGSQPTQETIDGTLAELARRTKDTVDRRAAILVVGRVAALRQHLRWFDVRPLFGKRVLVTRARDQAAGFVQAIEAAGGEAIEAPMIRILPPDEYGPLDEACARAGSFEWIVFASRNAVDAFLERLLASPQDVRALAGVRLCAVGAATAARLAERGLKADLVPPEYRAESIAQALGSVQGRRILLPRADIGREALADDLRRGGAQVVEVVAYRTGVAEPGREDEPDIYQMLLDGRIDVVTFTSPSAVRNFARVVGAEPAADLLRPTVVAAIGPVTADAAAQFGITAAIVPAQHTVPALVDAIVGYFETRRPAAARPARHHTAGSP
ncbi:MAG: uroporphyrinogen-III C-methyltransferase [Acidobacteria bacterium]|nr:uroporphyrinogen-III C-methyltransferase [Acidobacteriota bacterium]